MYEGNFFTSKSLPLAFAMALLLTAPETVSATTTEPDYRKHLDCAGNYLALSLALPLPSAYLLMFKIAPRSGYAQHIYIREAKAISKKAVRFAAERRKKEIMAAFEAGETTLEDLIVKAHACDAIYGHDPVPTTLKDFLKYE